MQYKPLDLSFLSTHYSPQQANIRNTAQMIMSNAGWSKTSEATLKEIAKANKAAAPHKPTFLSGLFDLLQTPLYGVANALDEALAGHQSDSSDSVVSDVGKTIGGVFTGAGRGIGAGLRGATSILDVMPGVNFNDQWQTDPTDKTHFSDVALRQNVGMSTKDAMNPKNWDAVKAKLQKLSDKSVWDKTFSQLFIPDDLNAANAREQYFRNNALAGIPSDIGADPLNLILPGIGAGKAATAGKDIVEGLDAAKAASATSNPIINALKLKNASDFAPKSGLELGHAPASPVGAIAETVTPGTKAAITSVPSTIPKGDFKNLANLGRREIPKQGLEVPLRDQQNLVKEISTLAGSGEKGWVYKAADLLRAHPNVKFSRTESFLQNADKAVAAKGLKHNPANMAPVLARHIADDVAAARTSGQVERRVMNQLSDVVIRPGAPKLKRSEAILANQTVRKFEGEILGRRSAPGTGEGLARAIAGGRNVRYSGPQQARMWNQITSKLKYADSRKYDKAVRILRATEDYFISKGVIPHSAAKTAESVPLRLSQVAEALGPQFLGKSHAFITGILRGDAKALAHLSPNQVEAIQALRASEAVAAAPAVQSGMHAAKQASEALAKAPLSVARKNEQANSIIKDVKTFTAMQGGGDAGAHVVGEYMGNILGRKDAINSALNANRLKTEAWLAKSAKTTDAVNDADFIKAVNNAITKASDLPAPAQVGKLFGPAARVADWLGARFNAAYGVQDMRQTFLIQQASAMETTARRARLINQLGRNFSPSEVDLWHEAFRTAQTNGIADGRVAELHSEIAKVMENLFGGTGLRSGAIADSTVVGRSRLLVDELNRNLKRFGLGQHQFTDGKKVKDAAGIEHDFSKGMDWMHSWEAWNVKNPYEFLHKVQNAVEHTVREKNMFDEIVSRFASPTKNGPVKYAVDHPRLKGFYFNQEGASQAKVFVRMLEEVSTPNSKSLQYFDHVLSKLKASLTIYIPGHHWTNLIGDTYYNWIAGVNKPIRYEQAIKTMLAQKGRYGDFASFEQLTGPKALEQAMARSMVGPDAGLSIPAAGTKTIITMQDGTKVTADMIYTAAFKEGILPSARVLEEVGSDITSVLDKIRPLGGKGQRAVHQVSEIRDHIPRLAQFIDGISKSKSPFAQAVATSAKSVRKWHPDGLDLTKFERTVMKRVFPFYSWTRKAIPLAIESAVFAGPKVMAYPRLMEAIALSNGVNPAQGTTDPFPTDQLFPDWLRNRGIGPIAGGSGNYSVVNPSTPVLDIFSQIGNPGQSAIDMLNPMGKVPLEVAQGTTLGRGQPIGTANQPWSDYFAKQIPAVSQLGRASGQFGVSKGTKAEGFPNWTNILNMLTGVKKVDTGKYQKSGQFDLRDYLKNR